MGHPAQFNDDQNDKTMRAVEEIILPLQNVFMQQSLWTRLYLIRQNLSRSEQSLVAEGSSSHFDPQSAEALSKQPFLLTLERHIPFSLAPLLQTTARSMRMCTHPILIIEF